MRWLNYLGCLAIPIVLLVHFFLGRGQSWEPIATFTLSALGVIPLAHLMGWATEQLAQRTGPTWGGLLNASFGNAAELIIGIVALSKGYNDVVKASLTGSILGNLLLVSGASMVVGGWKRENQHFSKSAAEANAGLMVVAVVAMLFPALFHFTYHLSDPDLAAHEHGVSVGTSVILLVVYALGLLFALKTHAHIFCSEPSKNENANAGSVRASIIALLVAAIGVAIMSELLVGSVEPFAERLGWNRVFIGVIVLAIIGNAAEHSTALLLAHHDDMDTAMSIVHQSSMQIALFVVPMMVLISSVFVAFHVGHATRLDLVFSPMEVVAVMLTTLIVFVLGLDGKTNWFEGVMLLAVYVILAITFFYILVVEPAH